MQTTLLSIKGEEHYQQGSLEDGQRRWRQHKGQLIHLQVMWEADNKEETRQYCPKRVQVTMLWLHYEEGEWYIIKTHRKQTGSIQESDEL